MSATFDEVVLARQGVRIPQGAANGLIATSDSSGNVVWESVATATGGGGPLLKNNDLSDVQDVPTARTNLGLGSAATHAATDFAAAGSVGSGSVRQFSMLEASGDSYGQGTGSLDGLHGFNNILAAMLNVPLDNHSIGGAVAAWPNLDQNGGGDGGYANVLQTISRANVVGAAPYLPLYSLVSLVYGFNDLWNNGHTNAIGSFTSAMRLIISRYRSARNMQVLGAGWSGSTNLGASGSGLNGDGSSWAVPTASPATYTYTVPADVPAGSVVCIYGGVAPSSVGSITFTKNGTAQAGNTITLANICNVTGTANLYNGWCSRFTVNPSDTIGITITYTAGTATISGAMIEALNAPVILLQNCPHVPATPATYGWASQAAMWADIDSLNTAQQNLAAEFADGRVKYYDIVTALGNVAFGTAGSNYVSDNLHPTPEGHAIIAQQALAAANSYTLTTAQISEMSRFEPERTIGPRRFYTVTPGVGATVYPYTMRLRDQMVQCGGSGARTVALPDAMLAVPGAEYIILDAVGNAATGNITVNTWNAQTINGATSYVINTNYGQLTVISTGTKWVIRSVR